MRCILLDGTLVTRVEDEEILDDLLVKAGRHAQHCKTYSQNGEHSTDRYRQEHETGNTSIEMMGLGEDNWVRLEKKIQAPVHKAHISCNGDEHRFANEDSERPGKDVMQPFAEADGILLL